MYQPLRLSQAVRWPISCAGEGDSWMTEKPICPRCGYIGPVDARYCAHCGRALVPLGIRLTRSINLILSNLSPFHLGLLGLVISVAISALTAHLVVMEFSFPLSLIACALVIGCGYAYLGWQWNEQFSNRNRLVRMLLVIVCIGLCLVAVWLVERWLLRLVSDRTHMVLFKVPGVYRESSPGFRHMSIESGVLLPYGLAVMTYGVLAAIAGNLVRQVGKRRLT
jgi:hypothetical protein